MASYSAPQGELLLMQGGHRLPTAGPEEEGSCTLLQMTLTHTWQDSEAESQPDTEQGPAGALLLSLVCLPW